MKKIETAVIIIFLLGLLAGCAMPLAENTGKTTTVVTSEKEASPLLIQPASPMPEKQKGVATEEELVIIKGEIDHLEVLTNESARGGQEIVLTLIGFKEGQGTIAKGLYPGLQKGKKVKLFLKPSETIYRGAPTFIIYKIDGLP